MSGLPRVAGAKKEITCGCAVGCAVRTDMLVRTAHPTTNQRLSNLLFTSILQIQNAFVPLNFTRLANKPKMRLPARA
jgi:hypothetical protein